MNTSILPVLLLIAIFTLGGCGQRPQSTQETSQASAHASAPPATSKGHQLFITHCASCHQGGAQTPSPNAVVLQSRVLAEESLFKALLRQPFSAMMPAFGPEVLSDEDVQALYDYLKTTKDQVANNETGAN